MSEEKRPKSGVVERLPFDCWCQIILYFSQPVRITIKDLYSHVKLNLPQCTKNIVFRTSKSLPTNSQPHFTNLLCTRTDRTVSLESISEFARSFGFENLNDLFTCVFSKFRNLIKFHLLLCSSTLEVSRLFTKRRIFRKEEHYSKTISFSPSNSPLEGLPYLRELRLQLFLLERFELNVYLPKLRTLEVQNYGRIVIPKSLNMNFSKLPVLRSLTLNGFNGNIDFDCLNKLDRLCLSDYENEKPIVFNDHNQLEELRINRGVKEVSNLGETRTLKTLHFTIPSSKLTSFHSPYGRLTELEPKYFPRLITLSIQFGELETRAFQIIPSPTFRISCLPLLKKVSFIQPDVGPVLGSEFTCSFFQLPSLTTLRIINCECKVKILDHKTDFQNMEEVVITGQRHLGTLRESCREILRNMKFWKSSLQKLEISAYRDVYRVEGQEDHSEGPPIVIQKVSGFYALESLKFGCFVTCEEIKHCFSLPPLPRN